MQAAKTTLVHESTATPRPRLTGCAAGFIHGLLLALSFPPVGLYGCVFLAPLPLLWAMWSGRRTPLTTAFWVALGVLPWWGLAHIWITSISALGFVPLAILLSGYTMLAVWGGCRLVRRWPAMLGFLPVCWVGVEFLRGVVAFHGYPWYLIAHPLADTLVFAWPAAFVGTFGVSLLVMLPATAAIAWYARQRLQTGTIVVLTLAWPIIGLVIDPWPDTNSSLRIAIVQTNVPQSRKISWSAENRYNDWQRMRDLIVEAGRQQPDMIVLPEAMLPGMTLDPESLRTEFAADLYWARTAPDGVQERLSATMLSEELLILQRMLGIPILIGGAAYDNLQIVELETGGFKYDSDARYNTVFVIEDGLPPTERYDKVLLTPFGETMPYISASSWLESQMLSFGAEGMQFDLNPGQKLKPVEVNLSDGRTVRLATPICFEATMPWVCRSLVGTTPDVAAMVNLTNDGWFGTWNPARQHHLLCARWRSIETGVAMVRCANTGISTLIDQRGQIVALGVLDPSTGEPVLSLGDGVRVFEVPISDGRTPYTRIGDILGWTCLAVFTLSLALTFTRNGRKGRFGNENGELEAGPDRSDRQPKESST